MWLMIPQRVEVVRQMLLLLLKIDRWIGRDVRNVRRGSGTSRSGSNTREWR